MRGYIALLSVLLLSSSMMAQTNEPTLSCNGTSENGNSATNITNVWFIAYASEDEQLNVSSATSILSLT